MDTAATGDTFDISNLDRLGKSEVSLPPGSLWSTCVAASQVTFRVACNLGGAGSAGGQRGQLPDRVREEAGKGPGHPGARSAGYVQEVRALALQLEAGVSKIVHLQGKKRKEKKKKKIFDMTCRKVYLKLRITLTLIKKQFKTS